MSSAGQQATREEAFLAWRAPSLSEEAVPEYPQASYYRARYYDPTSGRFLSEDPIGFAGELNFYSYANNRVVDFDDPFGLCPQDPKCHCGCTKCHIVKMLVTGYDNSFQSTGKNPGDPGYGITTSGKKAGPGTIAAPRNISFGTGMFVPGYGCGTVTDHGGKKTQEPTSMFGSPRHRQQITGGQTSSSSRGL